MFCSCHFTVCLLPPRFVCKNNGVLFENQLLQIGIKSEYRQNLGEYYIGGFSAYFLYLFLPMMTVMVGWVGVQQGAEYATL